MPRAPSTRPPAPRAEEEESEKLLAGDLHRARDLLQRVADASPDLLCVKDLAHRYVMVNRAFARRMGVAPEDVLGKSDADFFPPEVSEAFRADDRRAFAGEAVESSLGATVFPDGSTPRHDVHKVALRDAAGTVYGLLGFSRDTSAGRRAADALRESDARFRALLDGLPDAVLVHHDARYVYANAAALEMLGYASLDAFVGTNVEDVLATDELSAVRETSKDTARTLRQVERRGRRRDGSTLVLEISTMPTVWGGEPSHVIVGRDVSARSELLTTIARMDRIIALGTLAAGVGHEINNPLAYIMGNLELAAGEVSHLQRDLSLLAATATAPPADLADRVGELRALLEDAREGAERVRSVVNELRSLSRAGDDEQERISLARVIDSAVNMTATELRHRARLVKDYGSVPDVVANESRLSQVFVNLFVNAAQSIPEGDAARHEVRVSTSTDATGRAVVIVADTGAGIAPGLIGRVFDPFFTTKPVGAGTGLGLSICQNIVQTLGGEISVESVEGRGTTFRIVLPAAPGPPPALRPPRASEAPPAIRARVLVIDDDPFIGRTVTRSLARDHEVVSTTRGQELLDRLDRGERFDLVLCDLMMPDLTGMDLHAAVAQRFPDQARGMVFMTGGAFTPRAEAFLATDVLRLDKPFTVKDVRALVRKLTR